MLHAGQYDVIRVDHEKDSFTRAKAWCFRFFTLIQCFDQPPLGDKATKGKTSG
jgi:hypothetical protein